MDGTDDDQTNPPAPTGPGEDGDHRDQPDQPERPPSPDLPDGPAGREGQGDPESETEGEPDATDAGHRPGDAGEQPVPEQAPGSLGGDNGGA